MSTFPLLETEPLSPEANHRIFTALTREMTMDVATVAPSDAVDDATISYLDPAVDPASRRRKPWLLAVAALAAGIVSLLVVTRDQSARTRTDGPVTPETMPIYLPTWLPDGYTFYDATDFISRDNLPFRDQIYRDTSQPVGARVVRITTSLASAWGDHVPGHPIIIKGRPASDTSDRDIFSVVLTDGPISMLFSGRGVSYAEIERIAGSAKAASTNPADGADVSSLPDGLTLVVDQTSVPENRNITVRYSLVDNGVDQLDVNIWPASSMNLDQWTMERHGSFTRTRVRGHDAISFADVEQSTVGYVWQETTGIFVQVVGSNRPAEQVRRAAESLRRVSSQEWTNLLKSKGIAVQDVGAPGSPETSVPPTTAVVGSSSARPVDAWNLPLLVPGEDTGLGQLMSADDTTAGATFDGRPHVRQRRIYRETGTAPGSRAVQVDWSHGRVLASQPVIERQAPFTDAIPPDVLQSNVDPKGLFFQLSGRGFSVDELEVMAKSATATWAEDRVTIPALPNGFVEVESGVSSYEQYRSTILDYGSVRVAMNPIGSGTIESYAIARPGSFAATKVRGHDGYSVTDPANNTQRLVWVEAPGLLLEVKGTGTDVAPLQRLAESLQPVSTDAWTKLLATAGAKPETVKAP